ncbi:hypothetical protein FXF51_59275 [Nonomuraea sp. PA05]|uniref:hypothetical protein n=1 Tax=Nonomuraea sp. PA05 TaxID=2604466 RepID=UPI0011D56CF5|nr:hypothetical protein [Nonomuraea sp. PA05]TYB46061.1 hypothetical protein FXF51_59275 [Nonomuraea sp. PA05]
MLLALCAASVLTGAGRVAPGQVLAYLIGANAGAALGVVTGFVAAGAQTGGAYLAWALGGALAATGVVLVLGPRMSPLKLVLAGAALDGAEIPVGVVTSILGGPFLLWTLMSDRRS